VSLYVVRSPHRQMPHTHRRRPLPTLHHRAATRRRSRPAQHHRPRLRHRPPTRTQTLGPHRRQRRSPLRTMPTPHRPERTVAPRPQRRPHRLPRTEPRRLQRPGRSTQAQPTQGDTPPPDSTLTKVNGLSKVRRVQNDVGRP
jgi:hypothetical protein